MMGMAETIFQRIIDGLMERDRACRLANVGDLLGTLEREGLLHTAIQPGRRTSTSDHPDSTTAATAFEHRKTQRLDLSAEGVKSESPPTGRRLRIPMLAIGAVGVVVLAGGYLLLKPSRPRLDVPPQSPPAPQGVASLPTATDEPDSGHLASDQPTALDPQLQSKIQRLLTAAEGHLLMARLTEPPGSNAADAFQRVLKIDPTNVAAHAGLKHIADTYAQMATESLQAGRIDECVARIAAGLGVMPDHAGLLELKKEVDQRRVTGGDR